ncbi:MAG: aminotransferase class I/II-fold pyridoxal phosphate-dependent enzyme [Candidatus Aminicenantes bacterium]|nr:aminotransferase class I/II-fold pyridoxal phosphate-dependent enzyme [Candidatus Aminicenantes bacterium]
MNTRQNLRDIVPYRPPERNRRGGLYLDANENPWGPSPRVKAAIGRLSSERIAAYPDAGELTEAAARRFGAGEGELILTNGADEAIYALMSLFLRRGGQAVMPEPGFDIYRLAAGLCGGRIRGVPLGPRFAFHPAETAAAIGKSTRLVVLVTPNNPTGTEIKPGEIEAVAGRAARFNVPVLVDETYAGFRGRFHGRLTRRHSNLVVVGSFSKYFGLAGLRLGYVIASKEMISSLRTLLPPYSVNAAALAAGTAALESESYSLRVRREVVRERGRLAASLRSLGLTVYPSAANFLCLEVGPEADRLRRRLAESGIFVKSFPSTPRLSGCLRVTVGRPEDNRRFKEALEAALPIQAILFDMDGVLVDVSGSYLKAIEKTVLHFTGRRVSQEEIRRWKLRPEMNNDWDTTAAICRAKGRDIPRPEVVAVFQEFYLGKDGRSGLNRAERWIPPLPVLARLSSRYRLGIVTGRPREEAGAALRRFKTGRHFQDVIALEDAGARQKPNPFGLQLALRRLGVRRAAYFGDTPADMAAARTAGLTAVAVLPPGCSDRRSWRRTMAQAGADVIADNIEAALEEFS